MSEDSVIRIQQLSHRYDVQWVVRDVNLEIPKKGIYGLLGANGAGKSTMMNIVCGVIKPTQGKVFVKDIDVCLNPIEAKQRIGFLPQKPPLYDELTIEEYLEHVAELHYVPKGQVKQAVEQVLERCSIAHFRKRLIGSLSGGYQQRIGIAQAMIHKPEIVFFDEPTNGLDPNQILEIRRLVKEIAEEYTVILSTHILSEVQALCDHVFMINKGQVVFNGRTDEFEHYVTPNSIYVSFEDGITVKELEHIPGVGRIEGVGKYCFRIYYTDAREVFEQIARKVVEERWKLLEIYQENSSLDEVFAELSKK